MATTKQTTTIKAEVRYRVSTKERKWNLSKLQRKVLNSKDISIAEGSKAIGRLRVRQVFNGLVATGLFRKTVFGIQRTALGAKVLKAFIERGK